MRVCSLLISVPRVTILLVLIPHSGDKLETAVNIGRSCNLLQPDSHTLTLANMTSRAEFAAALQTEHAKLTAAIAGGEPEPGPAAVGSRGRRVHGHSKRTGRTAGASIGARAGAAADEGRNYAHHTAPSVLACASPDGSSISIGIDSGTPSPSAAGAIADESIVGRMGRSISETFASTEEGIGMRMRRSISDTLTATAAAVAAVAAAAQSEAEAARNTVLILDGPSFAYFDSSDPVQCAQLLGIGRMCRSVIGKPLLFYRLPIINIA